MKRSIYAVVLLLLGVAAGSWLHGQPVPQPVALPRELTSYRDVVKGLLPAVVSIETRAKPKPGAPLHPPLFDDPRIPEEFRRPPAGSDPNRLGFGSGFIVDPKGVVLTNFHVVDGATEVEVTLHDGRKFTSKEIKTDEKTDLAIVRLDTKGASLPGIIRLTRESVCTAWTPSRRLSTYIVCSNGWS